MGASIFRGENYVFSLVFCVFPESLEGMMIPRRVIEVRLGFICGCCSLFYETLASSLATNLDRDWDRRFAERI